MPWLPVLDFTAIVAKGLAGSSNGIPDSETREINAQRIDVHSHHAIITLIATNFEKSLSSNTEALLRPRAERHGLDRQCIASFGR